MKEQKNIYKIEFKHYSPKDSKGGIETLVLAENDEQVYDYCCEEGLFYEDDYLSENDDNDQTLLKDDKGNVETFKERMLRLKGLLYDKDFEIRDAFYGVTVHGWSLIKENIKTDYSELIELGLMVDLTSNNYAQ